MKYYYVIIDDKAYKCESYEQSKIVSENLKHARIFEPLPKGDYNVLTKAFNPYLYEKVANNPLGIKQISNTSLKGVEVSWWDKPNGLDPRYSNRFVFWTMTIAIIFITWISWPEDPNKAYDRHIQNLKNAKDRRLEKQEQEEWFKMMEAHPEAFERK